MNETGKMFQLMKEGAFSFDRLASAILRTDGNSCLGELEAFQNAVSLEYVRDQIWNPESWLSRKIRFSGITIFGSDIVYTQWNPHRETLSM